MFFCLLESFSLPIEHTHACTQERHSPDGSFFRRRSQFVFTLLAQPRVTSSFWCCPPSISSILDDHDELSGLPGYPGRAGSLINRPVTIRTIRRFWHPRTGCTALLLLSATTELLIINLISQHDPQPDSQLPCHRYACFP
jgi:hypothetical protein